MLVYIYLEEKSTVDIQEKVRINLEDESSSGPALSDPCRRSYLQAT